MENNQQEQQDIVEQNIEKEVDRNETNENIEEYKEEIKNEEQNKNGELANHENPDLLDKQAQNNLLEENVQEIENKDNENKNIEQKEETKQEISNEEEIKQKENKVSEEKEQINENEEENNLNEINNKENKEGIINKNENVLEEVNENQNKDIEQKEEQKEEKIEEQENKNNGKIIKDNQENKITENNQNNQNNIDEEPKQNITIKRNLAEMAEYDRSIKVIILGDSSVGKSSLLNRLQNKDFHEMSATLSIEYHSYILSVNTYTIRMQIWDTAGQEKFNSIVSNYYKGTEVGILVYSIDRQDSFINIQNWYNNLKENNSENTVNILIGNKKDLDSEKREVSYEQGNNFAKENNFLFFREISCKSGEEEELENIMNIFDEIGKYFYNFYKSRRNQSSSVDMNYVASDSMIAIGVKQRKKKNNGKCCG